jgi:hypothetical protein
MVDPNDQPGLERHLAKLKIRKNETYRYLLILGIIGPACAGVATVTIGFFYIYKVSTNWDCSGLFGSDLSNVLEVKYFPENRSCF